jgi:hypothetical protein
MPAKEKGFYVYSHSKEHQATSILSKEILAVLDLCVFPFGLVAMVLWAVYLQEERK